MGASTVAFQLLDAHQEPVTNATVDLLLTRRATTAEDIPFGPLRYADGYYWADDLPLRKAGPWIFNLEIQLGDLRVIRLLQESL